VPEHVFFADSAVVVAIKPYIGTFGWIVFIAAQPMPIGDTDFRRVDRRGQPHPTQNSNLGRETKGEAVLGELIKRAEPFLWSLEMN